MTLLGDIFTKDKKPAGKAVEAKRVSRRPISLDSVPKTQKTDSAVMPTAICGVLVRPHMTEKTAALADKGTYVFVVSPDANKQMIARAVETRYGVKVVRVRVARTHEKERRRGRQIGWKPGIKKAIVELAEESKIETL